jgi:hypothetical protein
MHLVVGMAGNVVDVIQTHTLLHGGKRAVRGGASY